MKANDGKVSTKIVEDNYGPIKEGSGLAKTDKRDIPYKGIADSFNYGGATGKK